ncbi:MAG: Uma2 family endonuclease [Dehalococcoidia bacterium]
MVQAPPTVTAVVDSCVWPELPERNGYEMVDGQWVRMPIGNKSLHAAGRVIRELWLVTEARGHGRVLQNESSIQVWPGSPNTYRKPDAMYFAPGRLAGDIVPDGHIHAIPDIVVEGISKSEKGVDILEKVTSYLDAGVRLVWLLYPQTRIVMVYRPGRSVSMLGPGDTLTGEDVAPAFALSVEKIFEGT